MYHIQTNYMKLNNTADSKIKKSRVDNDIL